MRIRKKKWAEPELAVCDFYVKEPEQFAGKWKTAFKKEQPLILEIGCGKGDSPGSSPCKTPTKILSLSTSRLTCWASAGAPS